MAKRTPAELAEKILEHKRATMVTTRGQFAVRAYDAGLITEAEAENWAGGNSLPALVQPYLATLEAKVEALSTPNIRRNAPLIYALKAQLGLTDSQVDGLFV